MLSINNKSEQLRKDTAKPNRFALRKLSVGLCSVLVGLTFMGLNASADQLTTTSNSAKTAAVTQTATATMQSAQSANQTNPATTDSANVAATSASVAPASQASANVDEVNVNDWAYTRREDGITLTGFNGHIVDGKIIVPNSYDFSQAGIIFADQKVYIDDYFRNNTGSNNNIHKDYASQASEFIISHNGDGRIYATGDWGDAFNGTPYKVMDLTNLDVSGVTRMSQMFAWSQVEKLIGLDHWDTGNVTDMGSMFINCQHLTDIGDISGWNVSKVANMVSMFELASSLKTPGDLSHWNVSNVENMAHMFAYATSLTSVGDLSNWRLPKVQRTDMMFKETRNLTNLGDLSGWDLASDTNMSNMFDGASKLVDLGNLEQWHTGNVTDMQYMFNNAEALTNIGNLDNWDTSKVQNMQYMFNNAHSLSNIGKLDQWNTGNVTNMQHMFDTASVLTTLGDLSNWNTGNVTDMQYMFNNDANLQHIGLLNHWNTSKVTNMRNMFFNNTSLDELDLSNWDTGKVTDMVYTFASEQANNSLKSLGDLSHWNVSKIVYFFGTFSHLAAIKSLGNLANWNTAQAQNMQVMFYEMRSLESLDVSNWDTSNVTNMIMMFMDDHNLTSIIGLANWNVSKVTAANAMFCRTGLTNIDIHVWDLSQDTDTRWMFAYNLKPLLIDMRGVKLPTSTNFSLLSFYGNQPMVVYSDAGSKLFALNTAQLNNYYDWVGNTTITVTGRHNTNYLTLRNSSQANNAISTRSADDVIANLPMDFVFTDKNALIKQMQEKTQKSAVNQLVANKYGDQAYVANDLFDHNNPQSLLHNFTPAATTLVADTYDVRAMKDIAPAGQADQDKVVTRTIHITHPDHSSTYVTQPVHFTRVKTVDAATNDVLAYGNWELAADSATGWDHFDVPQHDGYTSLVNGNSASEVLAETVDAINSTDKTVEVSYQPTKQSFTQKIVYQDAQGNIIGTTEITGNFDVEHSATLSEAELKNAINSNIPAGWKLVDNFTYPGAQTISSTAPDAIVVSVEKESVKPIEPGIDPVADVIFETADGRIVGRSSIHGLVGQTISLNLQVPAGYEAVNALPTEYIFTDATHQQLIILVRATNPDQPDDPNQPVSPDKPVTPDQPARPDKPTNVVEPSADKQVAGKPSTVAANRQTAQQLPQTGNRANTAALLGLGLVGLISLLGLGGFKKQDRE